MAYALLSGSNPASRTCNGQHLFDRQFCEFHPDIIGLKLCLMSTKALKMGFKDWQNKSNSSWLPSSGFPILDSVVLQNHVKAASVSRSEAQRFHKKREPPQ